MIDRRPESALSRRAFLAGSAGIWIAAGLPRPLATAAARADEAPRVLTRAEWRAVDAITERIIPTDETPGASAAGCVNFIDKALANEDADALPLYRAALAALEGACRARAEKTFVELDASEQDTVLAELEDGRVADWETREATQQDFFATVRAHTLLAFLADPHYGGNHDYIGWKTLGFPGPVHQLGGSRPPQLTGEEAFVPVWERASDDRPNAHSGHGEAAPNRPKR
jgi:gluconate 2-dehydrogenase gamma chain